MMNVDFNLLSHFHFLFSSAFPQHSYSYCQRIQPQRKILAVDATESQDFLQEKAFDSAHSDTHYPFRVFGISKVLLETPVLVKNLAAD
jgi:hypothetical protein